MRSLTPTLRRLLLPALLLSSLTLTSCFCKDGDPKPKKAKHEKSGSKCGTGNPGGVG